MLSMYFSTCTSGVLIYYLIWLKYTIFSTRFGTILLFEYFFSEKFRKESSVFLTLKRFKHYINLKTWILSVFYHKAFKDLFLEMFVRINFLLMLLINSIQTSPIVMGDWPEELEFSTSTTSNSFAVASTSALSVTHSSTTTSPVVVASSSASAFFVEIFMYFYRKPSSDGWIIVIKYGGIGGRTGKYKT